MRIKFLFLVFTLLLFFMEVSARKFYFSSSTGNDANTVSQAQNSATPWKTILNLHKFANGVSPFGALPNRAAAGDTFLFKCGDVFIAGFGNTNDDFGIVKWWNGVAGYSSPTGTANNPIVFTSYGTGAKPNFLYPNPTTVIPKNRYIFNFKNVGYLYFDNLQINDTRFPINDKVSAAFTCSGFMIGESNASICNNIKVTNCNFSNTCYGIRSCARIIEISNNTFTNFKSCGDTIGINDIGADALQPSGYKYLIKNNLIQGSWAYANPNSSSMGKLGGGLETINDFDSSLIIYNTFFDNSGAMEFGQNAGTQYGPNDDTFAYNKFINNSTVSYVNVTGTFACTAARIHFWNNIIIENNNSRHTGPNFGKDVLGDGQSFLTWSAWPSYPRNPSDPAYFPSSPKVFGYATDAGVTADTLYDIRNNIIWNDNGLTQLTYPSSRTKIKYRNNLYRFTGGSSTGNPLNTGELITTSKIFTDTSGMNPMNWIHTIISNSPAINLGINVGLTKDFFGNPVIEIPDAGIHELQATATPLAINVVPGSISCFGGTTNVTVSGSGGTLPYSGIGTFSASSGTRTFTITDATGATKSTTITLTQPNAIILNLASGRIITYGGTTSLTATASGGTGAYTYKLNNGAYQPSNVFNNVPSGVDTVFVKDANGCITSSIVTLTQPAAPLTATATAAALNICNGATTTINVTATGGTAPYSGTGIFTVTAGTYNYTILDSNGVASTVAVTVSQYTAIASTITAGTISVYGSKTTLTVSNVSGGLSPYTYAINGGVFQTSNIFSNIGAGTHNIVVKDSRGCSKTNTISLTQPASTLNSTATASNIIACNGGTTTITVAATGGTAPYTGTGNFTVPAGTYTYNVTDAVGSVKTTTLTITQPSALISNSTAGRIIVFGGTTTITVTASGGTGTYSYKLNSGVYQTSNIFSGVPAGRDTIYVKDANNCVVTNTFTITQPLSALTATATVATPIICYGGTAVVNVAATGGTAPYTGIGTFSVVAGTYNYTVTDSNGVTNSVSLTVTQPSLLAATVTTGTIAAYGGTTTFTVAATGGTPPYSYAHDNGNYQLTNVLGGIAAGNHTIYTKDAKACLVTKTITVTQPASTLNCTATASGAISCNGGTTTITVAATGGTPPYTGTGAFTVAAGTYSYSVTDAVGSVKTATISVTQPPALIANISAGRIIVYGGTTTITVTATGGTGAYSYKLNSRAYQTSNIFTAVAAGRDTIYVKDANNCVVTNMITITQPLSALTAIASITSPINCNGGSAVVNVSATGGTAPYIGTGTFTVAAGTYNYTVTDSNGVTNSTSITVTQPTALAATVVSGVIAAYGGVTSITSTTTGGTLPYTYALNNGVFQTSNIFNNIIAGSHIVTIKDAKGCLINKSITITQPVTTLNCTATASGVIACNGNSVLVNVAATGGTPPYTGTGSYNVPAGNYTYTVTDAVGSVKSATINITQPTSITPTVTAGRIIVYGGTTSITVTATGGTGAYTYKLNSGTYQTTNIFTGVPASRDTIYVKDANGCIATSVITITQPNQLIANYSNTPIACNGGTSIVSISASGGIMPYTGTGLFNQLAGTTSYTIRDSAGTSVTISVNITQPTVLSQPILTQGAAISTYGGSTTITISGMSGGTLPYTYASDNGSFQTNSTLTSLGGNHIFKVKDANGCLVNKSMLIYQPLKIFYVNKSDQTCAGASNGSLSVRADGGYMPYKFRIYKINGTTTSTSNYPYGADSAFFNLLPNIYTIRVKDSVGNLDTVSIIINATTVSCTKSTNSFTNENGLTKDSSDTYKINPNPVGNNLNFKASSVEKSIYQFEIFDITGKLIKKQNAYYSSTFSIPVDNIQTGYYFLKIKVGKKSHLLKFYKN